MKKNKITKIAVLTSFVVLEIILLILINCLSGRVSKILCFTSIVLALAYSLTNIKNKNNNYVICLSLFFTMCADFCLVILVPMQQGLSMVFFSLVQIGYMIYLLQTQTKKQRIIHLSVRVALIIIVQIISLIILKSKVDFLSLISMFYFTNLILNLAFSFCNIKQNYLLVIGFVMFICCDILVGLGVGDGIYFTIPKGSLIYNLVYPNFNLIWTFYIPSQTLISCKTFKRQLV